MTSVLLLQNNLKTTAQRRNCTGGFWDAV